MIKRAKEYMRHVGYEPDGIPICRCPCGRELPLEPYSGLGERARSDSPTPTETLKLPLPHNRANARWHWRKEKNLRDNYFLVCRAASPYPRARLEKATLKVTFYLWSSMDPDNLVARLKWPLDFLVHAGFIADDSPKVIKFAGIPAQRIDRANRRLEIELYDGWSSYER